MSIELIGAISYAAITTITTAISFAKNLKQKTDLKKKERIIKLAQVVQKLPNLINEAEASVGGGNGPIKKTLVLQQAEIECKEKNVNFNLDQFNNEVENILTTPQKKFLKGDEDGKTQ